SNRSFQDVNQDASVAGQRGVYTYRIQGAMGHYLGSLLPYIDPATGERTDPKFAQIYIVDPDMQQRAQRRRGIFADLDPVALMDIEQMMEQHNPFAQQFLSFGEQVRSRDTSDVVDMVFRLHENIAHPRTYNLPTVSEYPLLLPYGELGWIYTDTYANGVRRRNKNQMSLREHVAFRLHQKVGDQSALHQGGRLFQQWCVDQRAKCEQEQLRWVASHQKQIRADQYRGLQDALLNEGTIQLEAGEGLLSEFDRGDVGRRVILPSSHMGSPRAMYQSYQDSMAIVREFGKPDVFMTTTCSPTWEEIVEALGSDQQNAQDRPDIVARVWQQKLQAQLKDLSEGVLGRMEARIYVVEFQKRGLPHAHILIILAEEDKPRTRQIVDRMVSAELPDREKFPQLFETIMTCMLHGPCGAANPSCACMKDGKCTKGYPKPFAEATRTNVNGYPVYRRRRRAEGVLVWKGREYDNATINQWVVPYNPYLSQKYNCHTNVE
uniref:Helitron helicase-like domain-containing protein n=1 Tax=Phytophthora ramorum TaxID=164328 RepID=H3G5R8_PHYRM